MSKMPPCQERRERRRSSLVGSRLSPTNVPQHQLNRLEESMNGSWINLTNGEDFSRDGPASASSAGGANADADADMDDSVTSSIFSQSFAGSIQQGYAGRAQRRRSSVANANGSSRSMSSSISSMSSSMAGSSRFGTAGCATDSSRSHQSQRSLQSCLSSGSNPNSGTPHRASSRGRRLRVRFHPKVQCQITAPRSSYTQEEKDDTWYSSDAGKAMQRDILVTVQHMRSLHSQRVPADRVDLELTLIFGEDRTDRGLEHMRTARSIENRRRHKATVSAAVLDEQALQWEEGLESGCREGEMRIAEASMVISRVARNDAARKGRRDARYVERLVENEGQAAVDELQASLNKSMDALALGKAAINSMHNHSSKNGGSWTAFDDSGNAFAELKRTLSSEILESSDNPNEAEDAAKSLTQSLPPSAKNSKPAALKLERQGASRSMCQGALRRMRLAQLASLSSETSSADGSGDYKCSPPAPRRNSPGHGGLPRKNSMRAQGA